MPATVETDPPGIWCMFSDGSTVRFSLDGLPCPGLAEDLLTGLAGLVHPHGSVDAAGTAGVYVRAFREMTRTLSAAGFTGRAADLRRPHLTAFWTGTTADAGVLHPAGAGRLRPRRRHPPSGGGRADGGPELQPGVLPQAAAALPRGRVGTPHRGLRGRRRCCVRRSQGSAGRGRPGQPAGQGPVVPGERRLAPGPDRPGRGGPARAAGRLLTRGGPQAERLPGGQRGPVPDTGHGDRLPAAVRHLFRHRAGRHRGPGPPGDIDWAGDATVLLSYVKRRTAAESLNLPRRAVRLLEQWLSHSALLRSHAGPGDRERLWLGTSRPGGDMLIKKVDRVGIQRWILRHDVTGDDGGPLRIHRSRIRTTHLSLRDKSAWAGRGRATIDPNHSPQVEGDHYLTAATPAQQQSVDAIVADAQHDLIRRAHPPAVLTDADTADLARGYPQLVTSLGLDDSVLAELVAGTRDVFTAACADQLAGLHGPKGQPCPARPWVCLLCPLAVFAPRHAVNLLRLKAFFSRQWQQMPAAQFMAVFGPYSQRIGQVLDRFDPAVLDQAARHVADDDSELPLRPEERTR